MKTIIKKLIIPLLLLVSMEGFGQYVAIPDSNFGNWLSVNGYASCLTGSGTTGWQLDTTCSAVSGAISIVCTRSNISNLTGLQYFYNLIVLDCSFNNLTGLPALGGSLASLVCGSNPLGSLPALPASLTYLVCDSGQLTSLPALPASLTYLDCDSNLLTSLPVLPGSLDTLMCNFNQLTGLPALPAALTYLDCGSNINLASLPSLPGSLSYLRCFNDLSLGSIPTLPPTLTYLDCSAIYLISNLPTLPASLLTLLCSNNPLNSLPALPANLRVLGCAANQLTVLPALPDSLTTLNCEGNLLSSLPALPTALIDFNCSSNHFISLPAMPSSLLYLDIGGNSLTSSPSLPASLIVFGCNANLLTSLPALPPSLQSLNCANNQLSTLPALPDSLLLLDCSQNPALSCLPYIYQHVLFVFHIAGTNIQCLPDSFTASYYDTNPVTIPICTMGNGCTLYTANDSTVWPGDADNNKLVDNNDLLTIGLGYDSTGPVRAVQGIVWQADTASGWAHYFSIYAPLVNFNHADCNGDGVINADDTLAIVTNFGDVHAKTNSYNGVWRNGIPALYARLSRDTVLAGDTLYVNFVLGDSNTSVMGFYGLAFTYNFDPLVVDSTFTSMSFGNSWIGTSSDKISISKTFNSTGQIKAAVTRIDHTTRSGNGPIATAAFKITTDNISGKDLSYYANMGYISDVTAIDQYGHTFSLNAGADTSLVGYTPAGIAEIVTETVHMQPNPAHDRVVIMAGSSINEITIRDINGQDVWHSANVRSRSLNLDISTYGDGLYFVQVRTERGVRTEKLLITK